MLSLLFRQTFATSGLSYLLGGLVMSIVTCSKCGIKNRVESKSDMIPQCGRCGTPLDLPKAEAATQDTRPITVTDASFDQQLSAAGNKPILVDAWAPWCGPCRIVGPIMDQLAAESAGKYLVAKLNVDENPQVASRFQIASIPTMLIFKNGKLLDRLVGAQPKKVIADRLAQALT